MEVKTSKGVSNEDEPIFAKLHVNFGSNFPESGDNSFYMQNQNRVLNRNC